MNAPQVLGIIAGNGVYPRQLADAARKAGVTKIIAAAFSGETDPALAQHVDLIEWMRVGQLSRLLKFFRDQKVHHAIMAGQIAPKNLFDLRPDWKALLLLGKLKERNAESIFAAIADELSKVEVDLLPATTFLESALAKEGVIGRFALDFVVVRSNGKWDPYAIEINLRKGGTTHPFLTLQFLTDGTYDPESAIFTAPSGQQKFFVASDHVESPRYRTLTPDDLFDIVVRHNLHFDQTRQTGVVFHMMSALGELGRTGLTAVGNSHDEAKTTYARALEVLDQEAQGS